MAAPIEKSRVNRFRARAQSRSVSGKKPHLRQVALEHLEPRTLLAVLPSPIHAPGTPNPIDISNTAGNDSSPTIVVDPADPTKLAAIWVRNDPSGANPHNPDTPIFIEAAYSINSGQSWSSFSALPLGIQIDPTSSNPPKHFEQVDNPSFSFDRSGHLYEVEVQHTTSNNAGAVVLDKFDFSGGSPVFQTEQNLYFWNQAATGNNGQPAVLTPTLAVDGNVAGFIDPDTGAVQSDPFSGSVYVAWTFDTPPPSSPPVPYNRYTVHILTSTDGGATFTNPSAPLGADNISLEHDISPKIAISQGTADGRIAGGRVTVVYDDFGSGAGASPPFDNIWAAHVTGGTNASTGRSLVVSTLVTGSATNNYARAAAAAPNGIGPSASIASDNTLGSYSVHEGRLYVAYVNRLRFFSFGTDVNPSDNTDIFLVTSDNGGQSWSGSTQVNDDSAAHDGFSEGVQQSDLSSTATVLSGRPQFQPTAAVDPVTGALVISYYDARYDAARARVVTTIAASSDGGQTFAPQVFANRANTAFDEITRQNVVLGPIPDNQSGGNPVREATLGFGDHQGLAVYDGRIYPAWSSNENGGLLNGSASNNATIERLNIRVAPMAVAAGPRVISSTMGPVKATTVDGTTFNGSTNADGTPRVDGFAITFDRPVDIRTLTGQITAFYHSPTTPGGFAGIPVSIGAITPLDASGAKGLEATTFLVHFATPQSATGTYSYAVGPGISDMVGPGRGLIGGIINRMDQNGNAITDQNPGDVYAVPRPLNGFPFSPPFDTTTLPLIVPGPHVVTTDAVIGTPSAGASVSSSADNLVTNNTVSAVDVVFDRDMNPASFTPGQILRMVGPAGPITGPFTITPNPRNNDPDPAHPRTFRIGFPTQELSGTYALTLGTGIQAKNGDLVDANQNAGLDVLLDKVNPTGTNVAVSYLATSVPVSIPPSSTITSTITVPDNFTIQGITLGLFITDPNDPDLEATLTAPDGVTQIQLFTKVGSTGTHANFGSASTDTVFDDAARTPIQNGGPPFFGSFIPQTPLGVLVTNPTAANGTWTLTIKNDSTTNTGTLNRWSLHFQRGVPGTGLGEPVADRTPVSFRIFTMDPTNPLASNTWTAVGPAPIGVGGRSGRIGGLALDPSDPSGNTVFVGGASGGIWKTTNFLTTSPQGPTYIPLTDFGPTFGINIGGIAAFGRNNDPNQSIIFAATGEGDTGSRGVGFLRSMDGGQTWTLLDSTTNVDANGNPLPIGSSARDHTFLGDFAYKVVVDPKPSPTGDVIVYAALSGPTGGLWRSLDSGKHWQNVRPGQATDVVLDPASGFVNAFSNPTGNLQIVYAGFRSEGVFISQNQGQGWNQMLGGVGHPLFQNISVFPSPPIPVANPSSTPTNGGRIVLAKPFLTGGAAQDLLYEGWLYAAVITNGGNNLQGLYMTKDFGQNWTKIQLPNVPNPINALLPQAVPSNDPNLPNYDPTGSPVFAQGNYNVSLAIDPINPNVVYLGGTADGQPSGLIRVDTTGIADPYAFYLGENGNDGGAIRASTTSPFELGRKDDGPFFSFFPTIIDARTNPTINNIHDPFNPFSNATFYTFNGANFTNSGANVRWIPFDDPVSGSTDQHRVFSFKDPLTGQARLVFGDDQGVFTGVDAGDGTLIQSVGGVGNLSDPSGNVPVATGSRNGNLQITQFYYGAAQPSNLAAQIAGALFYGNAQDDGFPVSNPNIIGNPNQAGYGNLVWSGPGGDGGGVATDQTGTGDVYQYKWPCCGGNVTDFFQWDNVGRTFGLVQQSGGGQVPDPQWPFTGVVNFAVNPVNGQQVVISSTAGRIFRTENQGKFWLPIAEPSTLDGTQSLALAYGAPDPNAPGGTGSLDNFIYVGTNGGQVFVTQTGGGAQGNQWTSIDPGDLDGSAIQAIVTNPTRGNHEAFVVTLNHVYHISDSVASGAKWENITGNLFQVMHTPFLISGIAGDNLTESEARYLTSIQADWRYVIPDNLNNPNGPTHPMLYVGGEGGVYRSFDKGQTWTFFPDSGPNSLLNSPRENGNLPVAHITDLDLSLGNVNPTTGRPDVSTGFNVLLATTYGRGSFAIRLAPIVFPNSLKFDPSLPPPSGSDSGIVGDGITNVADPVIDGFSEQTAFGNVVTISLIDMTNPNNPVTIPLVAGTNQTDPQGRFAVQIKPGYFKTDGSTDGPKVIGVQATDQSGTKGNIAIFNFTLNTGRPGKPGAPDLEAGSDSGLSNTDNITNVAKGAIFDVLPSGPNGIAQNVELLRDGVVVATVQIPAGAVNGVVQLTDPGPVSDGPHVYTAEQIDIAGNTSLPSDPLTVTFDTGAPNNPAAPTLDPNDDTGVKGDGQTQVRQPHLIGTLVPETVDPIAQVQIIDSNGAVKGTATSAANGSYSVQFSSPLADGVYSVKIQAEDVAGNLSALSPVFILQINNKLPTKPTISLLPSDDSGLSNTDNITNVARPHLIGKTDPGLNVDLIDTNGDVTGTPGAVLTTVLSTGLGNYLIQFPSNLPDKVYHIQTQARDAANNKTLSNVLVLTIDTTAPSAAPTLMLDPADDTGVKGDGITTVRRPHFIGAAEPGGVVQIINATTGAVLATTTATAGGNFSVQLANDLNNGTISLEARSSDIAGNVGPTSTPAFNVTVITVAGDYDADGKADLAVFRPIAPTSQWFILQSKAGGQIVNLGQPGDIPMQGDFDGDGRTDVALYRPSTATWYILRSQLGPLTMQFGEPNVDIPVAADYDGDGRTDLAVYRPTTGQWFIIQSSAGARVVQFGQPNVDRPEPGDYDADGKADLAVYRPTTGQWFILQSSGGGKVVQLPGQPGDMAVPGAYDGGGKTEPAIFRPSTAQWLISGPSGVQSVPFGQPNVDIPVPLDYDGDGKTDVAVYRPTTGQWLIRQSTAGPRLQQFGAPLLDIPVPEPLDYRAAAGGLQTSSISTGSGSGGSGVRAALIGSNSFVNSIAVLAPSGGDGAALHTFAAPAVVPVPGPSTSTPPVVVSTPANVPTGPAVTLPTGRRLVNTALHRAHQPIRLTRHHEQSAHHRTDTALAAAIQGLGRIKGGRFLPGL